ncbi:MAG: MFS transporter, partial [Proteobacteria bacterium]|nr:MFS transporter [Pseudomonadota bacterium]
MVSTFLFRALQFLRTDPRLLAYGFLLSFGSGFGQTYFIALFSGNVRGEYGISHGEFGAVYAAATLASAAALTWTGRWIDHVDLRRWTIAVVVLLAAACLAMALTWNIASLVVAIFLLRQMGQGLMHHTSMTSQARYYVAARGRAVATAGMGFPLAEAVLPPAVILLVAAIGWRQSWLVIAAAIVIFILPLSLWLLRGHGARHETHPVASRADSARDGARAAN